MSKNNPQESVLQELVLDAECPFAIDANEITKNLGLTFCRIHDVRLQVLAPNYDGYYLDATLILESNSLWIGDAEIKNRIGVKKIATSSALCDCGKFNFNFKTEKYLPFEGAGLDSQWKLTINACDNFSKDYITDIVIYISYSARST